MSSSRNSKDCWQSQRGASREEAWRNLLAFTLWTKPDYQVGLPHRILCRRLDDLIRGDIRRLMVFMPPRHGKSELVSRRLPAYFLGKNPDAHVIACSYSADLAERMSRDCQRIMDGRAYRELFPSVRLPKPGTRQRNALRTDGLFEIVGRQGSYRSTGVGGGITGMGFDLGCIDDPLKNFEQAHSQTIREKVDEWYTSTFWTRQSPQARILITMTRWHHDDIAGRLLARMAEDPSADQWSVLRLPGLADDTRDRDDDRPLGAALWPERYPVEFFTNARATVGSYQFAGMYQQLPTAAGGNHFKEHWFIHRFRDAGEYWLVDAHRYLKSDCSPFVTCNPAASELRSADHTAIGVWAVTPANDLLALEVVRGRFGIEGIVPELLKVCQRWNPGWLGVEADGFQVSIVRQARDTRLAAGAQLSHEGKGKLVRATPAIILAEAGKLWLPDTGDWVRAYIDELVRFTGRDDKEDDQVDITAYAVWQMPRLHFDTAANIRPDHSDIRPGPDANANQTASGAAVLSVAVLV